MNKNHPPLRERLLAQFEPDAASLASYRQEILRMIEDNERSLQFQRRQAGLIWVGVVLLGTALLTLAGLLGDKAAGNWLGPMACFFLITAAVELLKYFVERNRVELLKEIKGLEVQLLDLKELLATRGKQS